MIKPINKKAKSANEQHCGDMACAGSDYCGRCNGVCAWG